MAGRSLNRVQLIGNLTRDPELRYTPQGTAVCTFGLATNRQWTTDAGEKREETEFHRIVAWNKLAELCAQLLAKGIRVYIEGRIQTRTWTAQDGTNRQATEIIAHDMIVLGRKAPGEVVVSGEGEKEVESTAEVPEAIEAVLVPPAQEEVKPKTPPADRGKKEKTASEAEDIPF